MVFPPNAFSISRFLNNVSCPLICMAQALGTAGRKDEEISLDLGAWSGIS